MRMNNNLLIVRNLDQKLKKMASAQDFIVPTEGWVNLVRNTLKMSLGQLGKRMNMTAQSVREVEVREQEGGISLKSLRDAAEALDMKMVYFFLPKDGSLEKMIEKKALEIATQIVKRTSLTMKLEDQENSPARIQEAIADMTNELKRNVPKQLWD